MVLIPAAAQAAPPSACFTVSPASPLTNETTTLNSSCSTDDKAIVSRAWDLDNDGQFDDGTAATVTKSWPTSGTYTVRLRVMDEKDPDIESKTVEVRNRAPVANFSQSPASPNTSTAVTLTSTSTDPDGTIAGQRWALDADGVFNDGTGASVTRTFTTPGTYNVKLEVTDNRGATSTVTKAVTVANRAPTAAFTTSPASAPTGQSFSFTSTSTDPDGTIAAYAWDTDGDATADFNDGTASTASRSFATPGTYTIRLRVTDNNGAQSVTTNTVTATNRAPTANFTISPASAPTGDVVNFASTSTDPDGTITLYEWDTDGDAIADYDGDKRSVAARPFATPGTYPIRLRVTDNNGAQATLSKTVTITNRPPVASFTISPETIVEGDTVTLTSTATDPDGKIASQGWDLDNDGAYDDATAATASFTAGAPGAYTVGLRVVDDRGIAREVKQTITVDARPQLPEERTDTGQTFDVSTPVTPPPVDTPPTTPVAPLRFLDPFPVVRLRGRTTGKGAQLSAFTVRAPHGSSVNVRCSGRGCPVKKWSKNVKTKRKRGSATLHVPKLERFLRAGVQVEVWVTGQNMVGKYTRIKIRGLNVPIRSDRCLLPGSSKPSACPSLP